MNILEEFSSNESEIDIDDEENYNIENNIIKCNNDKIIIEKDSESVITLSKKLEIQNNKKIQFIKQMFNYLLKNFTPTEFLIVHSIYNHNIQCFMIRNKTFKEYVLLLNILKHLCICFTKSILENIFEEVPINGSSKKFLKLNSEINSNFNFNTFKKKHTCEENVSMKYIPKQIKYYVNGFLFYLKNIITLEHNYSKFMKKFNISIDNIISIRKIILKNENNSFCSDEHMKILSKWISNILKNILIYNIYCIRHKYQNTIDIRKSFDTQVQILINIFIYIIILYNSPILLTKEKYDKKKLEIFLTCNYRNKNIIIDFIKNKYLIMILKYIYENNFKKNIFSSRKFIRMLYKELH